MTDFAAAVDYLLAHGWTRDTTRPNEVVNGTLRIYWGADDNGPLLGMEGDPKRTFEVEADEARAVDLLVEFDVLPIAMSSVYRCGYVAGKADTAGAVGRVYRGYQDQDAEMPVFNAAGACYRAALGVGEQEQPKPQAVAA